MARRTRIFFATDLHGSSKCFRKFLNAGPIYDADVLVLGADLAGKAIQTIVHAPGGRWRCSFIGTDHDVADGDELIALERLIEDHGYYPLRVEPGEFEQLRERGEVDATFLRLMRARLESWLALADERLRRNGIPFYFMLGSSRWTTTTSWSAGATRTSRRGTAIGSRRRSSSTSPSERSWPACTTCGARS